MHGFSFSTDIKVRFAETDAQGIAHNANYLIWFEVARVAYLERYAGGYQRLRELGLLRAMGASGPQVIGSVLTEALVVGIFASAVGLVLGIGLAQLLLWLLPGFGFPVPQASLVVIGRTVFASAVVGIGVTMLAAVIPAIRAARTPPIAAISDARCDADLHVCARQRGEQSQLPLPGNSGGTP